jgi:glutamate racemase
MPNINDPSTLIGIFDSGVGGFSVVRAIRQLYPHLSLIYVGDQAHVPYGPRPIDEVQRFSKIITEWLLHKGASLIVVACNAASAAALYSLRQQYANIPFVGMEPAVKPAAEQTLTGKVGILATPATFQGKLYASVVERFAKDVVLYQDTCKGLVEEIEKGNLQGLETRKILTRALDPMLAAGIDTVVLGCTHYPFVIPLISEITGPQVRVIDPAPAVGRQVGRLLNLPDQTGIKSPAGELQSFTTAEAKELANLLPILIGEKFPVQSLTWKNETLTE